MSVSIRRLLNAIRIPSSRAICVGQVTMDRGDDVATDAERLIASFCDQAYYEARDRARGRCIDGAGSARHWIRVKLEIARRQSIAIGLTGADMRA
ncbi:MAG: hypothetical protein ACLPSF_05040 [Methylocella sp.]